MNADWLDYEILGESLLTWSRIGGVFAGLWVLLALARRLTVGYLRALAGRSGTTAVDIVYRVAARTQGWFLLLLALHMSVRLGGTTPALAALLRFFFLIGLLDVVYWVLSPAASLHADVRHRINLGLYERFAAEGIEFAYPTQQLYVSALEEDGGQARPGPVTFARRSTEGSRRE